MPNDQIRRFVGRWGPVLLPWLWVLLTTGTSLDSGFHWDEGVQLDLVQQAVESGHLLPGWYNYPSLPYWLTWLSLLPAALQGISDGSVWSSVYTAAAAPGFFLQVKLTYFLISSLAILWIYAAALASDRSVWEAFLAACLLAFSWEINYHLRWIAPDTVVMMWGSLWLAFVCRGLWQQQPHLALRSFVVAAGVAGLATGTKYPAGLLIVPVWLAIGTQANLAAQYRLGGVVLSTLAMSAAFLLTTPGALLDWSEFWHDVWWEVNHYRAGHYGYTIAAGPLHMWRMVQYLALSALAPFRWLAVASFLAAGLGVVNLLRCDRRAASVLLLFPLSYGLYFSWQNVMIVRNYLILFPFVAYFLARGLTAVSDKIKSHRPRLRSIVNVAIITVLLLNAGWLWYSARTIHDRFSDRFRVELQNYLDQNPTRSFWLSPAVASQIEILPQWDHVSLNSGDTAVILASEVFTDPNDWPANDPFLFERQFGPYEVNFNYYPTWIGNDRFLLMPLSRLQNMRTETVRDQDRP